MKQIIFFMGLFFLSANMNAAEPNINIKEGNDLYQKGDYAKAIEKYKLVIDLGFASSELYYNLGNAYFKTHNIKSAILYFERAKILAPADKDIDYNLEMARSFTVDKIEIMPELFFITFFKWIQNQFSAKGWAFMSIGTFICALLFLLLYLLSGQLLLKKTGFWIGIISLVISIASFTMGYQVNKAQTSESAGVIFTPTINIKSSPTDTGNNIFILHEGTKVEILDNVGEWYKIRIADGSIGWLKKVDLVVI